MILQELTAYYERLQADPESSVPEFGFGRQGVHFCLLLDAQGKLVGDPVDMRREKGRPDIIEVPGPVKRASGVYSNFAWDNTGYVLGADDKGNPERAAETHGAFKKLVCQLLEGVDDAGARALLLFLESWHPAQAEALAGWEDMAGLNIVFRLVGEKGFLHERPVFRARWLKHLASTGSEQLGMCLVTGQENAPIAATHPSVKGVLGAQSSGAALVSFNIKASESFKKKQNFNGPVSEAAAFAYTTALNRLLAPESGQKIRLGETTMVFWSGAPAPVAESLFSFAFDGKADDPDLVRDLGGLLRAVAKGQKPEKLGDFTVPFYVLGLAPNAARLSVRFWLVSSVGSMVQNIVAHYEALRIKRSFDNEPEYPSPGWILKELAPQQDFKNISPILEGELLRAILQNKQYPRTLLTAVVTRVRADKIMNYLRAAITKAYLTRNTNGEKEIQMALDKENTNVGYRLGRLFALVEVIQQKAIPGTNATVRDRFLGAASAFPATAFPSIVRNAQNGLAKLRKRSLKLANFYEGHLDEITYGLEAEVGFPPSLSLEDQGRFFLGYYHQRQGTFTKKEDKAEG